MLYDNILDVLNNYYGLDAMQKVYTRGVELGLKGNTQWGRYYNQLAEMTPDIVKWQTKSGKSVGLWSIRGTQSVPSASLVPTTKNTLTTIDMAMGTEVGEYAGKQLPKLVTAGGASGSTSIGSFVVGEVLPAIGAVACGVVLGVAVDKLLYKSNPDYWDEKLPTLNPETWDDIILGRDTKIPFLHNTNNGKTYINENMLAYTSLLGEKDGWFSKGAYDEKYDDNFPQITSTVLLDSVTVMSSDEVREYTVNNPDVKFTIIPSVYNYVDVIPVANKYISSATITLKVNGRSDSFYLFENRAYEYDRKTVYYDPTFSYDKTKFTANAPVATYTGEEKPSTKEFLWVSIYGNHTIHHSDAPEGINKIGTVPDLTGLNTIDEVIPKLRTT